MTGTGASQKHDAGRASIEDPGLSLAAMKGGGWTDSMLWRAHIRKSPCKWECFGDQEGREGGKKGMDFPNKNKRVVSSVHLCSVGSLATVCSPCSPPILAHPVLQMYFSCFPPSLPPSSSSSPPPPLRGNADTSLHNLAVCRLGDPDKASAGPGFLLSDSCGVFVHVCMLEGRPGDQS